jgi:response regulator RpfG family c-di-GMP phosphodiesterase
VQIEAFREPKTLTNPEFESLNVMVVDDEPLICETLNRYFQNMGVLSVRTVDSGEKALREIDQKRYDYIFMDLMMPGIDGIETLKRIQKHHLSNVIMMTGYPSLDSVIEAMRNGASDFLVKPFRLQDIKIILERLQRIRLLMEKNWLLHQELEEKKEVEKLNKELEKRIRYQSIMYNIVDSLSRINRSEDLYNYLVEKSSEFCNAKKACFMIYEQGLPDNLLILSEHGLSDMKPGTRICLKEDSEVRDIFSRNFLEAYLSPSLEDQISLYGINNDKGVMVIPFNIRDEPFGILAVAEKKKKRAFDEQDEFILRFLAERTALNIENIALYDNIMQSLMASLMSLVSAIEAKDSYTQQHSSRVTEYSRKIAHKMGCGQDDIQRLESSGPIHDIGKIGINDRILNKPGELSHEEFEQIKTHPIIGATIVSPLGLDPEEEAIIRNHHERWDGHGYPDGLAGKNIPRLSRILSVADAYDAMNSNRAYRKALPTSTCIKELERNSGSQFDPEVIEAALTVFT